MVKATRNANLSYINILTESFNLRNRLSSRDNVGIQLTSPISGKSKFIQRLTSFLAQVLKCGLLEILKAHTLSKSRYFVTCGSCRGPINPHPSTVSTPYSYRYSLKRA